MNHMLLIMLRIDESTLAVAIGAERGQAATAKFLAIQAARLNLSGVALRLSFHLGPE